MRNANTVQVSYIFKTYLVYLLRKIKLPVPTKDITDSPRPNQNILSAKTGNIEYDWGKKIAMPFAQSIKR